MRASLGLVLLASWLLTSACDQGARDVSPAHGPGLHLLASYPADGQGTAAAAHAEVTCDVPTPVCPVPTNLAIELRFDRFLLPGGGLATGVTLYSGNPPANAVGLSAEYDLIERVVVLRPSQPLQPNTLYTAEVLQGSDPSQGFWAFDRAPLEEGPVPLRFSFTTGDGPGPVPPLAAASQDTCETMAQGPFSTCVGCHATEPGDGAGVATTYPPMGLDLSSPRGLYFTAVGHVAHQTETGNSATDQGLLTPVRFGVQMNVVDPGNPASSYLMYKLLQKAENFPADASGPSCASGYHAPVVEGGCKAPSAEEIVRMREWFARGDPMPKNGRSADGAVIPASMNHATLLRIAAWIASGASCPEPGSGQSGLSPELGSAGGGQSP